MNSSAKMSEKAFQILPIQLRAIPVLANISSEAFETDSQTEMKSYGKAPFCMREYALQNLPDELKNSKTRIIKAVDEDTGAIGVSALGGFAGFNRLSFLPLIMIMVMTRVAGHRVRRKRQAARTSRMSMSSREYRKGKRQKTRRNPMTLLPASRDTSALTSKNGWTLSCPRESPVSSSSGSPSRQLFRDAESARPSSSRVPTLSTAITAPLTGCTRRRARGARTSGRGSGLCVPLM